MIGVGRLSKMLARRHDENQAAKVCRRERSCSCALCRGLRQRALDDEEWERGRPQRERQEAEASRLMGEAEGYGCSGDYPAGKWSWG